MNGFNRAQPVLSFAASAGSETYYGLYPPKCHLPAATYEQARVVYTVFPTLEIYWKFFMSAVSDP